MSTESRSDSGKRPGKSGGAPPMVVDIEAGREHPAELLGAVDAALASDCPRLRVRVLVAGDHPGREALAELCGSDPRVEIAAATPGAAPEGARAAEPPEPGDRDRGASLVVTMPPSARPSPWTLTAIQARIFSERLGSLEVAVPGHLGPLERLGLAAHLPGRRLVRVRAAGGGGGRRIAAASVGMGSSHGDHVPDGPPPPGDLAHERAEHLRHRARSATGRARNDRYAQRLARERMRIHNERARIRVLEQRRASLRLRYAIGWRARQAAGLLAAMPGRLWGLVGSTRSLLRRARRHAVDRLRARRT